MRKKNFTITQYDDSRIVDVCRTRLPCFELSSSSFVYLLGLYLHTVNFHLILPYLSVTSEVISNSREAPIDFRRASPPSYSVLSVKSDVDIRPRNRPLWSSNTVQTGAYPLVAVVKHCRHRSLLPSILV